MSQAPRISLSNRLQTKSFLLSLSRKFFIFNIDLFFLLWGIFLNISFYLSSLSLYSSIHYLYYGITFHFFAFFSFLSLFDLLVMKPESCIFHVISTVMLFAVILMQNEPWHLQLFRWIMLSELSSLYPETLKRNPLFFFVCYFIQCIVVSWEDSWRKVCWIYSSSVIFKVFTFKSEVCLTCVVI